MMGLLAGAAFARRARMLVDGTFRLGYKLVDRTFRLAYNMGGYRPASQAYWGLKGEGMQQEAVLHPASIIAELKKNKVSHVVWLPDSETNFMYQQLTEDPDVDLVPVCREGETMAIAAGLWVGGKRPVCLIQNTGIFESGDSIRGLGLDVNNPLVMLVGYRGWDRHGVSRDSAARFIEHILHAWGISYYLVETDDDASRISLAMEEADRTSKPVAVLVGTEFGA